MGKILAGPSKDWVCVPACSVVEKILAGSSEWRGSGSGEASILMVWLTRIVFQESTCECTCHCEETRIL